MKNEPKQLPPELVERYYSKLYFDDLESASEHYAQIAVDYAEEAITKALNKEKECVKLAKIHLIGEERYQELVKHNYAISMLQHLLKKHEDGKYDNH